MRKRQQVIDPTPVRVLRHHTGSVLNVVFTENGSYCLSCSQDKSLVLWSPTKGTAIKQYKGPHNYEVNDAAIASDNARFVSCGGDKAAFLWDVTTGNVIKKFGNHGGKIHCCKIAANNQVVLTGCYDKAVRLWDNRAPDAYRPTQTLYEARDAISEYACIESAYGAEEAARIMRIYGFCFSLMIAEEHQILAGSVDGCVRCYDIRKGRLYVDTFSSPVLRGGLSHDGRCYVVSCLNGSVHLVELGSGQHLNVYKGHKNSNYSLNSQFTPDDGAIVGASEDGSIYVWDICAVEGPSNFSQVITECSNTTSSLDHKSQPSWGCVFTVRFHPKEWVLLSCHNDKNLRVWQRAPVE